MRWWLRRLLALAGLLSLPVEDVPAFDAEASQLLIGQRSDIAQSPEVTVPTVPDADLNVPTKRSLLLGAITFMAPLEIAVRLSVVITHQPHPLTVIHLYFSTFSLFCQFLQARNH